ncbi:IniB N-terminal domain-containing protein [Parasphingorhabdus pacifica]
MPNSQQEGDLSGHADTRTSDPGTGSAPGLSDEPTLYEFLTRLSSNPDARAAFEADPRASLDQAGLGDMTATDVLHATSLVFDYAPVEVVENNGRVLQDSADKFATSSQYAAINHLHPAHPHEQEVTELSMLNNTPESNPDFSDGGDADEQTPAPNNNVEHGDTNVEIEHTDSHNLISVHDVVSDNNVANVAAVGNTVGGGAVNEVTNTVDNTVSSVGDLTANVGDVASVAGGVSGIAGDVTGVAGDANAVGGVTNTVGGTLDTATEPVGGVLDTATAPVEPVVDTATAPVEPVLDTATAPVGEAVPAPSDLPIVGDVAGGAVENVAGGLPVDGLL